MKVYTKPIDPEAWRYLKWLCKWNHLRSNHLQEFNKGIKIYKANLN